MPIRERLLRAGATALVIGGVGGGACVVFEGKLGYDPGEGLVCLGDNCGAGMSCCVAPGNVDGGWFGECSAAPTCANEDFTRLLCAAPFDCNVGDPQGKVCCAKQPSGSPVMSSTCTAPGDCSPTAAYLVLVLCNPKDTLPCPGGGSCDAVTDPTVLPAGYFACR
jgi:hypothetical protein